MIKRAISLVTFLAVFAGNAVAQFSTGTEKIDFTCGQSGFNCLQGDALVKLVGKKLSYKHIRPEFVSVTLILNKDGSAEMKNAKGDAGRSLWEIVSEKVILKTANWGTVTLVVIDMNGTFLVAPGAGTNNPMLLPLHVE